MTEWLDGVKPGPQASWKRRVTVGMTGNLEGQRDGGKLSLPILHRREVDDKFR